MGIIKPITREMARDVNDPELGRYGVIDDFIAVVDGCRDLKAAFNQARALIQKPEFQFVIIARDRSQRALKNSASKIQNTFAEKMFGHELMRDLATPGESESEARMRRRRNRMRGTPIVGRPPASGGTVIPWSGMSRFSYQVPLDAQNTQFETHQIPFWKKTNFLGRDFQDVMQAARQGFPEFMSWYIKNGKITSDPGLLHCDTGYHLDERRKTDTLPQSLLRAAGQEEFTVLPGNVAMTIALVGGGTIAVRTNEVLNPAHFNDDPDRVGYQTQNGDIMIARAVGWPDDPVTGLPRLPGYHCSPMVDMYGNENSHRGRVMAGTSCETSYPHPLLQQHIEQLLMEAA